MRCQCTLWHMRHRILALCLGHHILLAELVQTGCQLYLNLTTIQILHTQRMTLGLVAFES
jgi:hypothetical protein